MNTKALYAGSFDPITKGHLDVLDKAMKTFDRVTIAVGHNSKKKRLFSSTESCRLIAKSISEYFGYTADWYIKDTPGYSLWLNPEAGPGVAIGQYTGSLMKYASQLQCSHIVRGLRQAGDFNDEFNMAGVAGHLDGDVIFTHFICREEFLHVSSSTARELASIDEDISWLVTPSVEIALKQEIKLF